MFFICIFVFKQKTAYEMRISDWSSDVCSSDLTPQRSHGVDPSRGSGIVLLVDDEEIVLTVAKTMLVQLGYSVMTAENGKLALELYRANREAIDQIGRASCRERVCQ